MIVPGFWNCHARGTHSVVLARYPDGRPRLRMFACDETHDLWTNATPGRGKAPMSLAIHAHRSALTVTRVSGRPHQVPALFTDAEDDDAVSLRAWHYRSQILTGSGGFTLLGARHLDVGPAFVFDCIHMRQPDLHTIYVPPGERAAWLVHEHEPIATDYDETLYSDDDLGRFSFDGMYRPMTHAEADALVRETLALALLPDFADLLPPPPGAAPGSDLPVTAGALRARGGR
jgi:hypothetical protein